MIISTNWIKDFTNLPDISPRELSEKFTLATAEVEEFIEEGAFLEKIKVAKIVEIEKHPDADKLNLVTFDFGAKENKRVVCGAPNVRLDLVVPYAPLNTVLPGGFKLEPKKIRGVLSEGMLCSESELGISEESSGLMELKSEATIGESMLNYLKKTKDVLLDIDNKSLTHRPDLWGHYGMAREFATIFNDELKNPFNENWKRQLSSKISNSDSPIKVIVEKDSACKAYFGLTISNVEVGESPEWIKSRLLTCGLRPINNMVDISNYVMLELGIPNHIFDADKITGGQVTIKKVSTDSKFTTLDEEIRDLVPGDTVIADEKQNLVIAGIMGGLESGVNEKTNRIFIEVANWHASMVRSTSTRLGLRTDSSQRYEKTLDSKLCERTLYRIIDLITQLCPSAKIDGKIEYDGENLDKIEELIIETSTHKICNVLGKNIAEERIIEIFNSLDFKVTKNDDKLVCIVPSYRATKDIEYEADLIEEIGRVVGYDNIDPISPNLKISPARLTSTQTIHRQIRDYLVSGERFFEVMTYPMVGEKLINKSSWTTKSNPVLINALSKDQDRMRTSLIPSLLESVALNQKHKNEFRLFEIGRVYNLSEKDFAAEDSHLILASYHKNPKHNLCEELLNTTNKLLASLNVPFDYADKNPKFKNLTVPEEWSGLHPFEFVNVRIMGKMQGAVFSIHPIMLKNFKIRGSLALSVINLSSFESRPLKDKTKYKPLPKFPGSHFDCTVTVKKEIDISSVLSVFKKIKIKELLNVKVVDVYSESKDSLEKHVTLSMAFLDPEKTLSGDFLKSSEETIVSSLTKAGYPLKDS